MFSSTYTWASAQVGQASLADTIPVNAWAVIDWSWPVIVAAFTIALAVSLHLWLDERDAARHEANSAAEWSRLTRTVLRGRRDFGAGR